MDLLEFITFIALDLKYRNHPAAHKRLIMLAMVSVAADPGFARSMEYLSPPLTTPLNFFVGIFWANVLPLAATQNPPPVSAVGTSIAGRPPLRSERAQLTHSAPTLGV